VTTVLVLGWCLLSGLGSAGVITRLWPLLSVFNPVVVMCAPVCAVALSQARARLPVAVLRELFTRTAAGVAGQVTTAGSLVFGLLVTATDGTVFDLAATEAIGARFATPTGGRFPQARAVTVIECGTRRALAAQVDSCQVSQQVLWDRLVACLKPGTINLTDRNFFSMHRWRVAAATGAHLAWRVKNGHRSSRRRSCTLLDHGAYPAEQIAVLYAERWPRPRRDLLHHGPARDPRPSDHLRILPGLRPLPRLHRPSSRDRRRCRRTQKPDPDRPANEETARNPARPRRQLHDHHHSIKSTQNDLTDRMFRAMGSAPTTS
jgi:hypothetical protein